MPHPSRFEDASHGRLGIPPETATGSAAVVHSRDHRLGDRSPRGTSGCPRSGRLPAKARCGAAFHREGETVREPRLTGRCGVVSSGPDEPEDPITRLNKSTNSGKLDQTLAAT